MPLPLLYFDDDQIEALREEAVAGADVVMPGPLLMELVCDWRNMRAELEEPAKC